MDTQGNLYFTDGASDSVIRRDRDGVLSIVASRDDLLAVTGESYVSPAGLATHNGFVYVIDTITDSVIEKSEFLSLPR